MQEVIPHEAALTTTLKGEGKDAPWIVVRSRNAAHLQDQLRELEHGSVMTDLGRVNKKLSINLRFGANLDASSLAPQPSTPEVWVDPTVPAASAPQNSAAGAPAIQSPSAPTAAQPPTTQPQPTATVPPAQIPGPPEFRGASAPGVQPAGQAGFQQQYAPPVAQAPQAPQGFTPPAMPAAPAAPQQAAQGSPLAVKPPMPGAPVVLGRPAVHQTGSSSRGPWQAFFDPRSQAELASLPRGEDGKVAETDDVNHPGLAGGTHKFVMWLR